MIRLLVFEQTKKSEKRGSRKKGRKSKFGSDIHTPGHIETEYLHTKFHRRTTSKKKVQKWGLRPYRAKNDLAPWY